MRGIDLEEETGSYRLAVSPEVPDDGLTSEGRPRALRFKKHGRARDVIDKPNLDELRAEINLDEHRLPLHNLLGQLQTDPDLGLTPEQAHEILLREGPNLLTMTKASSGCGRFLRHIFGGFCLLLWLLSFLCFLAFLLNLRFLGPPNDNLIYGVLFLMFALIKGTISYCQELQSSKLMNSFNSLPAQSITVIRNGQKYNLPPEEIVVGDLVEIRGGDMIPADMRIISSQGCKVDNSNLTGESEPQLRNYEHTSDNFLETQNLVFFSTLCVEGVARGLVIYTGDRTVMGRIAALSIDLESSEPPLTREIDGFIRAVTSRAIVWGLIFFIVAFFTGFLWIDSVIFFIGFVAAIVPEGLLIIATVSLTLTAKRMASRNCLIKNLEAIETLGTSSIILCDKTGTLTQNRMVVAHLQFDNQIVEADTTEDQRGEQFDKKAPGWKTLSRCAMLCSRAEFKANQELVPITKRETTGDSSETAILRFLELSVNDVSSFRARYPKVCEIPFSTQDRIRITVHETSDTNIGHHIICMKGAPENILDRCRTIYINGKEKILSQDLKDQTLDAIDQLGNYGERVMGFCDLILPKDKYPIGYQFDPDLMNFPTKDLRFLGLISMIDPPRAAVPDAISNCRNAGIRVMMFTGDHPSTAHAIAKTVGIISGNNETVEDIARRLSIRVEEVDSRWAKAVVVQGHQLKQMTNQEIESLLESYEEIVFARASPQQKLAIVEVCQKLGHVVAVTGDGVNDAPALKRADVAIVPGIAGSDVSKQVADVILLDDNFATIARGVEEGRLVFENLRKSIAYALTSNAPEIFAFLLYVVLQLPLPLGLIGVILVDMITDIFPAISLAFEEPEPGVMRQKPRDPKTEELISADMLSKAYLQIGAIQAAAGLFSYFVIMYQSGWWFTNLVGIRRQWDSPSINDLRDSYNQDWTYQQRKTLEFTCHSGFFAAIVLTQWANLLICKTRKNSIFVQRNQNRVVHFALLVETLLAIVLIYTPGLNSTLHLGPLFIRYWLIPLPFSIAIFVYDELRKAVIRRRNTETTK